MLMFCETSKFGYYQVTMKKIPATYSSMSKYQAAFENTRRLKSDELREDELYQLFMHNEGGGHDSYLTEVYVDKLENETSTSLRALRAIFVNADKQPVFTVDSSFNHGLWRPNRRINAQDGLAELAIEEGLFFPRDTELDVDREFSKRNLRIVDLPDIHTAR